MDPDMDEAPEREAGELPPVTLDPEVQVTPYALFRAFREGRAPLLVDVRPRPASPGFQGAVPWPGPGWAPPAGRDVVLVDDDGPAALELARRLRGAGHERVRSLFGGLRLYDHALDPAVVGPERFLENPADSHSPA
ncbi:MAG: hypothetical protein ACOC7L_04290 [Acidobacteriota bacterium]